MTRHGNSAREKNIENFKMSSLAVNSKRGKEIFKVSIWNFVFQRLIYNLVVPVSAVHVCSPTAACAVR